MPVTELVGRVKALLPRRADLADVRRSPRRDLIAGITVAIVALPLALAFGVASGLGAQAGLATAVVAGTVAAVFGGSNLQVSGPTGAMTVVLLPVVSHFGTQGVLMVGAMAGLIIVALAIARMGRYVDFLPMPVVEGFTAGIAVVIALQQVPAALGISDAKGSRVWQVAADAVGMEEVPIAVGDHSSEEHTLLAENIVAYRLDGPLVFAAAHRFLLELTDVAQVRVVILRMSRVTTIDATGARVLSDAIRHLERRGIVVALSGLTSGHGDVLAAMGASMQTDYEVRNFDTTPQAIEYAREIIRKPRPA